MYTTSVLATAVALAGSAVAQSVGSAIVINSCDYPVYLQNTPSAGGGYSAISQTLSSGAQYSQEFTELSNGNGWSLKLSKEEGAFQDQVMQYEYTWHGWEGAWGGVIWYDLSDVNGNPWDSDWEITATGSCTPRQAAYQYSTDDAYGMQSCPGSSSITVELCSAGGSSGSTGGSSSSASPVESSPAPETSTVESSSTPEGGLGFTNDGGALAQANNEVTNKKGGKKNKGTPTTLATVVAPTEINRGGVTVTEVATQVVTSFVTATAGAQEKRHAHVARHAHHHHF